MESIYKPLGELVERVDERNRDGAVTTLLGVSIDKCFMPSVANVIGTDLTKYKIIRHDEFAVSLMQVSRDEKIPVACLKDYDIAIMSPAYSVFRVKDGADVLPDYLALWFARTEFDREATFIAVGGVRGSMSWEEFARMQILVPPIDAQRKLVYDYKVISDRIALKRRINENLKRQAREYLNHWMIENSDSYALCLLSDIAQINPEQYSNRDGWQFINYLDTGNITEGLISEIQRIEVGVDKIPSRAKRKVVAKDIIYSTVRPNQHHYGIITNPVSNMLVSTGFAVIRSSCPSICNELIYLLLTEEKFTEQIQQVAEQSTTAYPSIKPSDLGACLVPKPSENAGDILSKALGAYFSMISLNQEENRKLCRSLLRKITTTL